MNAALTQQRMFLQQDQLIDDTVRRERGRLRAFIRRRVIDEVEAEDILQDVLYELVATYRRLQPLEEAGAWLFRVARNRITDFFRGYRRRPTVSMDGEAIADAAVSADEAAEAETFVLSELLLPADETPDASLAREILLEKIAAAIDGLPPDQRDVFVAHEIEGTSFKVMAERSGVPLNTLLARKHYAVKYLRRQLQGAYDEWLED